MADKTTEERRRVGDLASLERIMTALQTDMRDLRGSVTRQLVEQDRRLVTMADQLAEILNRLPRPDGP